MARHAKYAVRQTAVAISPKSSLKLLDFTLCRVSDGSESCPLLKRGQTTQMSKQSNFEILKRKMQNQTVLTPELLYLT